jgi:hypothetical protein
MFGAKAGTDCSYITAAKGTVSRGHIATPETHGDETFILRKFESNLVTKYKWNPGGCRLPVLVVAGCFLEVAANDFVDGIASRDSRHAAARRQVESGC